MTMPLTSVTKDAAKLTLTVVGDYPVPQQRLWDAFADPRQLERFWGPPAYPATFTRHDFKVGGRAEYFLTLPEGKKWSGSWKFTAVNPIRSFEAKDGEDNAEDENMPASMKFTFDTTPMGSRLTIVTRFSSVEAMEQTVPGMEEGLRAAMPQLDALLAERRASSARA
ncbi:MAG: SRPBCC domain-containing protein [Planctomycetes bacterium]|nr:SRPBCC domain-containing protein [Planctomycetota bacterium]MBI3845252.1 SRPBCC domain-containing protein [Planctomycetota bacterium]